MSITTATSYTRDEVLNAIEQADIFGTPSTVIEADEVQGWDHEGVRVLALIVPTKESAVKLIDFWQCVSHAATQQPEHYDPLVEAFGQIITQLARTADLIPCTETRYIFPTITLEADR